MGQRDPSAGLLSEPSHLTVLGGLALRGSDGSLESRIGKRRLILLATLAASGERGVSRDLLSALFWPESDDAHASAPGSPRFLARAHPGSARRPGGRVHGYFHFYHELASLKDDPRVRAYWIDDERSG